MACKMKITVCQNLSRIAVVVLLLTLFFSLINPAWAVPDGNNNDIFLSNVGIGTTTPQGSLSVMSGNVGVGTIAPTSIVQVVGTVVATAFSGDGSNVSNLSAAAAGGFTDDGAVIRLTTITDNVGIGTTSAGNGKLMVYGGNVGIGTVAQNPSALLNVSSAAAVNLFKVEDSGDGDTDPFLISSTGNVGIGTSDPRGGKLIITGGNVGIGSLTPGQVLDVNGTIRSISGGFAFPDGTTQTAAATVAGSSPQLQYNNSGAFGGVAVSGADANGNIGIGTSQTNSRLQIFDGNVGVGTFSAASAILEISSTRADDLFRVNDNGTGDTTPFVITSTGNVGIGTAVGEVESLLDVEGLATFGIASAATPQLIIKGGASDSNMLLFQRTVGAVVTYGWTLIDSCLVMNDILNAVTGASFCADSSTTLNELYLGSRKSTTSNTRSSLLSAQTFGATAGTDVSAALLQLQGGLGTGAGTPGDIRFLTGSTTTSGSLQTGQERMTIKGGSGNIGVGTITPLALFEITSTAAQDLFTVNDAGNSDTTPFVINSTGNVGLGTISPFGGQLIVATTNGNVGIGSLTPGTALDVTGTVRATAFSGNGAALTGTSFTDDGAVVRLTTSSDNVGIGTTSASNGKLLVYGGNVGIGTVAQTPTATLEISTNAAQDLFKVLDSGSGDVSAFTIRSDGNVGVGTILPRGALEINNTVVFSTIYDNGNSGTTKTIDWTLGNNQKVTMTGNCTFTFNPAPGSVTRILLQLIQDGTGSRTVTAWPATVKWPSGSPPTLTTTATTGIDIVSCFYDGTNYYCTDALDFR